MDPTTLGIVGIAASKVYDMVKQAQWPVWVNQLLIMMLALAAAVASPFVLEEPFVARDVLGSFLTISGAMWATYAGGKMVTDTAHKVLPHPTAGLPKLTAANRQLLIDRYVKLEGLTPEAAAKKVDDLFANLPG